MTTKTTMSASTTTKKKNRGRAWAWLPCIVALAAALSITAVPPARGSGVSGSTTKVPQLRTVEGMVVDKSGIPIKGAVVYLQDSKSLTVKSYLSDVAGHFHFRQLPLSLDYDLWAEIKGKRSKTKSISQFNSKTELFYKLKVPVDK
jgi:Carboxypeptidase regulatory-like domain